MLLVNGKEGTCTVDMNDHPDGTAVVTVESFSGSRMLPWHLSYVSSSAISAKCNPYDGLKLSVDMPSMTNNGTVKIANHYNEEATVVITPNNEAVRKKEYVFKLGKVVIDGKKATFNIISKENGNHEPWEMSSWKMSLSYSERKTKTKLTLELSGILSSDTSSVIWLFQPNSGKEIAIITRHAKDGTFLECKEKTEDD